MVADSLAMWEALAQATGRHLYTETGVLTLGQPDDGHTLPGFEVMRTAGLPVAQLTPDECRQRFPQFRPDSYGAITYNPRGGMLHASECLLALVEQAQSLGAVIREGVRVTKVEPLPAQARVTLDDGTVLTADHVIVTVGPWIRDVLPELAGAVRPTRQQVCYLTGLPAREFGVGAFPVFLSGMHYYGFPLQGPGWFKVGSHAFGAEVDPNVPYPPDEGEVAEVRAFLREVIPAAANAPVALVDRCMYDVTEHEDFILDYHPAGERVIVGAGFSGHGFKFGILIGELLAALALGEPPVFPLETFRLGRMVPPSG
jgi:glycine/D-amino acid oxidase-like deaminating enzyme